MNERPFQKKYLNTSFLPLAVRELPSVVPRAPVAEELKGHAATSPDILSRQSPVEADTQRSTLGEQAGWVDEFGNVFPLAAWKPSKSTWHDGHKATWQPVYRAASPSDTSQGVSEADIEATIEKVVVSVAAEFGYHGRDIVHFNEDAPGIRAQIRKGIYRAALRSEPTGEQS